VPPLSVALDMTFANRNRGGSGVYGRALLGALQSRDDVKPWVVEGPRKSDPVGTMRWLVRGARRSIATERPDVLHCPSFVAPWVDAVPIVITVHDAAASRYPCDHPLEWRIYTRFVMPWRLRAASRIITGSEFAKRELVEVYRLDPGRVTVIPYGLDPEFLIHKAGAPSVEGPPVMLFPGAPIGRKNLDGVLRAMAAAADGSALAGVKLDISGARAQDFPEHSRQIRSLGLEGRVRWLGSVPFAELPAVYCAATLVVYPSLYEGFGFPPLEAMAVGTPVVASDRGSLPEVLGDAAVLIDPATPRALAQALEGLLTNSDLRRKLKDKGMTRARQFTWEKCAARTVEAYREVLGATRHAS